jgi:3-oxoacyl-[acyl-carrier-protein] synthase II
VVLESARHAEKRNARVYAEVLSTWQNNDAFNIVAPHLPNQVECMESAIAASGLGKNQISHIQAHGDINPLERRYRDEGNQEASERTM